MTPVRHAATCLMDQVPKALASYVTSFICNLRPHWHATCAATQPIQVDSFFRGAPRCFTSARIPSVPIVSQSQTRQALPAPVAASGVAPAIRRGRSGRQVERYWLCDGCSSLLTLIFERGQGMVVLPPPAGNTPGPASHLRLVQPAMQIYRAGKVLS